VIILSLTYGLVNTFDLILLEPMLNFMILVSNALFNSFGLAIIVLVIVVRLLMTPLTLRQIHHTRAMSAMGPKIKELQKKYAKDKKKLQQEMASVYKESGVSPMGCVGPMLIQLPLWIALYRSILGAVATTPEALMGLSDHLYSLSAIHQAVPLNGNFLWLNLAQPDVPPNGYFILPVLVAASMWVLQKMSTAPAQDQQQQSMNKMMIWMMPLMFAFFTLAFPSGLALFWVVSNLIGIVTQYFITGWGTLGSVGSIFTRARELTTAPQAEQEQALETPEGAEQEEKLAAERDKQQERVSDGKSRDKRKDRRRSRSARDRRTRRKSR
jgi:YidC/Oxa1 family membrane protein insertase